jgi:hypothetical protein
MGSEEGMSLVGPKTDEDAESMSVEEADGVACLGIGPGPCRKLLSSPVTAR